MSNSVDKRVVEMEFDNSKFEKNVDKTLSSLKNIESSLSDGSKEIKNINKAFSSSNFSRVADDVETITSRFSALGAVGFTAVQRVTNAAIDMGSKLVKGATVQPLMDGIEEYNLKLGSIQTIKTNTGAELDKITDALNQLNNYADKTIYNFAEMTRNIGTFTAAGVDLETSTSAIQGIANLAASSGSNAQQASTAMYQLSQALSLGSLKLQDWNSVVNAGMGGKLFQNALKTTAKAMGKDVDGIIEKAGSFRESLSEGWIDQKVLTQTLENFTYATENMTEAEKKATTEKLKSIGYTDKEIEKIYKQAQAAQDAATKVKSFDQLIDTTKEALGSGWAVTWEFIFGDLEEAQELFTGISTTLNGVIDGISDARNALFKEWHDKGGRSAIIEGLGNLVEFLSKLVAPIKEAYDAVFEPLQSSDLLNVSNNFLEFTKNLNKAFDESAAGKAALEGLKTIFTGVFTVVKTVMGVLSNVPGAIVNGVTAIWSLLDNVVQVIGSLDSGVSILDRIKSVFASFSTGLSGGVSGLADFFSSLWASLSSASGELNLLDSVKHGLESLGNVIAGVFNKIKSVNAAPLINTLFSIGLFGSIIYGLINVGKTIKSVQGMIDSVTGVFESFSSIGESIAELGTSLGEAAKTLAKSAFVKSIALAIGVLVASIVVLSLLDPDRVLSSILQIAAALVLLVVTMVAVNKIAGKLQPKDLANLLVLSGVLLALSSSLLLIAVVLGMLTLLDSTKAWTAVQQLGVALLGIIMALVVISLVASSLKVKDLASLGAVSAFIVVLVGSLVVLSAALLLLSAGKFEKIASALQTMALLLGMIVLSVGAIALISSKLKMRSAVALLSVSTALIEIVGALSVMALVVALLAHVKQDDITKGLQAIFLILVMLVGTLVAISALGSNITSGVTSIILLAAAMGLVAMAIKSISDVASDMQAMLVSAGILVGSILALALVLKVIGTVGVQAAVGSVGIIIMAGAIRIIAETLIFLSNVPFDQILNGLYNLASIFIVFAIGMAVIGGLATAFSGGLLALSAGLLGIAAAALVFSVAVTALTAAFTLIGAVAPVAMAGILTSIDMFCSYVNANRDKLSSAAANMVIGFAEGIYKAAPAVLIYVLLTIGVIAAGLIMGVPLVVAGFLTAMDQFLGVVGPTLSAVGDAVLEFVGNALNSLGEFILNGIKGIGEQAKAGFDNFLYDISGGALGQKAEEATQEIVAKADAGLTSEDGTKFGEQLPNDMEASLNDLGNLKDLAGEKVGELVNAISSKVASAGGEEGQGLNITGMLGLDAESLSGSLTEITGNLQNFDLMGTFSSVIGEQASGFSFGDILSGSNFINMEALLPQVQTAGQQVPTEFNSTIQTASSEQDYTASLISEGALDEGRIAAMFGHAGEVGAKAFNTAFESTLNIDGSGPVAKAAKAMEQPKAFGSAAKADGAAAVTSLNDSMKDMAAKAKSKTEDAVKKVKGQADSAKSGGKEVGSGIISGMISGIQSRESEFYRIAYNIGANAAREGKKGAKVHSPSKLTIPVGEGIVAGMIVGLRNLESDLYKTSAEVGRNGAMALSVQAAYMSELIDGIDDQPTIRPVLDLTDYEAGINRMNGLSTAGPMLSAGYIGASRAFGVSSTTNSRSVQVAVNLNYDAGADANQMAFDLGRALEAQLAMEAV